MLRLLMYVPDLSAFWTSSSFHCATKGLYFLLFTATNIYIGTRAAGVPRGENDILLARLR